MPDKKRQAVRDNYKKVLESNRAKPSPDGLDVDKARKKLAKNANSDFSMESLKDSGTLIYEGLKDGAIGLKEAVTGTSKKPDKYPQGTKKMKFKFSKKPNGGDLTGASSTREFKPQQDYAAKALAKRNQTKPDSDAQLTDYGLNKQVGESAIGRGDATSKTRFATSSQKNIMDVKGKAEGNASFKASATEIATEKMPKEKAKSIATYENGSKKIKATPKPKSTADKVIDAIVQPAEDIRYGMRRRGGEPRDYMDKEVESRKAKKYAEGTSGVETKPKKMGLFSRLKAKQEESNKQAAAIDAEDEIQATDGYMEPKESKSTVVQEKSFVGPKRTGLDAEIDARQSEPVKADFTKETKTNLTKGADANVAKWQAKRGLKADGIWGNTSGPNKSETQKAYEAEQKAKKSSTPKKMDLGKAPKGTITLDSGTSLRDVLHKKDNKQKSYKDVETAAKDFYGGKGKGGIGTDAMGNSYPTVKGKSYSTKTKNDPNFHRTAENMYGDPEVGGMHLDKKSAERVSEIQKKGDDATMSTAAKIGIGGTGATLLAAAIGTKKGRNISKSVGKTIKNQAGEFAEDIKYGVSKAKGLFKSPKKMNIKANINPEGSSAKVPTTNSSTPKHDTSPEAIARRAREAAAKQNNQKAAAQAKSRNTMKPRGEYMTEEQRAAMKAGNTASIPKQEVKAPTVKTFTSPTTKTVSAPETKTVESKGFKSKVTGDKFKKKK